jgi:penicillin-binding protein 2
MSLFVLVLFGAVAVRLFQLQILNGDDYAAMAHENIIRKVTIQTARGILRDSQGKILASSRTSYDVYIVPKSVLPSALPQRNHRGNPIADAPDSLPKIAEVLRMTPDERERTMIKIREVCATYDPQVRASPCTRQMLVREDVSRDIITELEQHRDELTGVEVVASPIRFYPYKQLASHLLGYISELDVDAIAKYRPDGYESLSNDERERINPLGYDRRDRWGAGGLERSWESHLRGKRGWEKRVVDARGKYRTGPVAERLLDPPNKQEPLSGRNLRLSIDIELTQAAETAMLPYRSGAVVVTETQTGRLLALYSKPNFDPNDLSGGGGRAKAREAFTRLYADPYRPMLDKTMSGAYPPGSTFKPFSALAALESHALNPEASQRCDGFIRYGNKSRPLRCTHVHGTVNMRAAIAQSCNIFFFKLAEATTLDPIARIASAFGLGQRSGLSVNPEAGGRMPSRAWYAQHYGANYFNKGFTLNAAIGQGDVTVTPLQLAMAYAAVANGGRLYEPQAVVAIETADGVPMQEFEPRLKSTVAIQPEHLQRVHDAMRDVLNSDEGTANALRDRSLDVAGKTGTAQPGVHPSPNEKPEIQWFRSRNHAWFAAFYPSRAPEISVVVLVEHGESGPQHAAPVAMQVIRDYQRLKTTRASKAKP